MGKKKLHPALQANADKLKRGEALHSGKKATKSTKKSRRKGVS